MKSINNTQEFLATIQQPKPVLLDFYADWCGPCQSLLPIIESLDESHGADWEIRKINVDKVPELAQQFKVRSIPALFIVHEGEVKEQWLGFLPKPTLEAKLENYLAKV